MFEPKTKTCDEVIDKKTRTIACHYFHFDDNCTLRDCGFAWVISIYQISLKSM
jgi:hypothetical protein